MGRPRDVDIVVAGTKVEDLRNRFHKIVKRETRFGGLQLQRMNWQFDMWPLERTWAYQQIPSRIPHFETLPLTTFFNLEAIAVEVWSSPGRGRRIYSGDDQFFKGVLSRTLEINQEENPFPSLCVVRTLVMAASIDFAIGPRLAKYLTRHGLQLDDAELAETQLKHYGHVRHDPGILRAWLRHIDNHLMANADASIKLPLPRQQTLWSEDYHNRTRVSLCILSADAARKRAASLHLIHA